MVLTPLFFSKRWYCGFSSVGRALASQAEGRGFESRNPLFKNSEKRCEKRKDNKKVKKVS